MDNLLNITDEDYMEGLKLGLHKDEIDALKNYDTELIAAILEDHPGSLTFINKIFSQNDKLLDVEALVELLVYRIDNPNFDPDYGYDDPADKKRVLEELGYPYESLENDGELEEEGSYINEYGEIVRPTNEEPPQTPLELKNKELTDLEEEAKGYDKKLKSEKQKGIDMGE